MAFRFWSSVDALPVFFCIDFGTAPSLIKQGHARCTYHANLVKIFQNTDLYRYLYLPLPAGGISPVPQAARAQPSNQQKTKTFYLFE